MSQIEKIRETIQWKCVGCQALLGYVENRQTVRIKRKDLYVQVKGGQVQVTCCRCGKVNELFDDKDTEGEVRLVE